MRLSPESLKVESYATTDVPETVGYASSNTNIMDCSSACEEPTCIFMACRTH